MTEYAVKPGGTVKWLYDATPNDSSKTPVVPAGKRWDVTYIHADLATTATVGNRMMFVAIQNATPAYILHFPKPAVTPASQFCAVEFYVGANYSTTAAEIPLLSGSTPNVALRQNMPVLSLPAGYSIQIADGAGIASAADDLTVALHYIEYDA